MAELSIVFAIPGDLATRNGGYLYNARLTEELRARGCAVRLLNWGPSFPDATAADRATAEADMAALPAGTILLADSLAYSVLPGELARGASHLRKIALVHHPLALESGLLPELSQRFADSERAALALADEVVVTSHSTGDALLADYAVPAGKITVAEPGTDPVSRAPRAEGTEVHLLVVGSVTPRKGHDVLAEALAHIAALPWRCTLAGSLDRDPACAAALRAQLARLGLTQRVALIGEVTDVPSLLAASDIFVLASRHEGYGMAYAEAMRAGLPVIGTNAGAIPQVVPPQAGILVPPDDAKSLAEAIGALVTNKERRDALAAGALAAGARLPGWTDAAGRVLEAIRRLG